MKTIKYYNSHFDDYGDFYLKHFGKKGQKWYHRYHQSYESKPTRSGKVGQEHFLIDPTSGVVAEGKTAADKYNNYKQKIIDNLEEIYSNDQVIPSDAPLYRTQKGKEIVSDDKIYVTAFPSDRQFWKDINWGNKELGMSTNTDLKIPSIITQRDVINKCLTQKMGATKTDYEKLISDSYKFYDIDDYYNYIDDNIKNKHEAQMFKAYCDSVFSVGGGSKSNYNPDRLEGLTYTVNPSLDRSVFFMQGLGSSRNKEIYNDIKKELSKKGYNGMVDYAGTSTSENYYPMILFNKSNIKVNKVNNYKLQKNLSYIPLYIPGLNIIYMPFYLAKSLKTNNTRTKSAYNLFRYDNKILETYNDVYRSYVAKQKPSSTVVKNNLNNYGKKYRADYIKMIKKYKK